MRVIFAIILGILHGHDAADQIGQLGQSWSTVLSHYNNNLNSVKIMLRIENYSNQPLGEPQYMFNTGSVYDRPQYVAPGMMEYMTGHKSRWNFRGVSGVVSWNIGNTGKMVVVMYYMPWSGIVHSARLAFGIFPTGNLNTFYNKMYSGEQEGFIRRIYNRCGNPLRYRDDPDFMVVGDLAEGSGNIIIQFFPKSTSGLASGLASTYDSSRQSHLEAESEIVLQSRCQALL